MHIIPQLSALTSDQVKTIATVVGVVLALLGLFLNVFALFKNLASRKLSNYQEIAKSHREIWKMTLDKPDQFSRVLEPSPDLQAKPITSFERRFVSLLLLHTTSAFYFAKHSDIIRIEQLRYDLDEFLSLPIPREVWHESSKYHNRDFVHFVEHRRGWWHIDWSIFRNDSKRTIPVFALRWRILLITGFPEKMERILRRFNDTVITIVDGEFTLTREYLQKNSIDLVVVFGYGKIISKDVFRCVTVLNMHPGYLPYNRGPNPNLWAILNGTPRGTTIHFMDKGVDTGDIIAQRIIPVPADNSATLQSSFNQIIDESASFFEEIWPQFRCGRTSRIPQSTGGTSHRLSDQEPILELMGDEGLNLPLAEFCSRAKTLLNEAHHRDTSPALAKQ